MEERNIRPEEDSKLPLITLGVLVAFIFALLYVGYGIFSDDSEIPKKEMAVERQASTEVPEEKTEVAPKEVEKAEVKEEEPKKEEVKEEKEEEKLVEPEKKEEKETEVAAIPEGGKVISHTVGDGETFFGIANRYGLKADVLKALNPDIEKGNVKAGQKIKVKVKAKHTIGAGDILSVVAKKYGTTKEKIMAANKLSKDFAKRGDELVIPF